jgi:hypothetical protein
MPPPLPGQKQPQYSIRGGWQTATLWSGGVSGLGALQGCISGTINVGGDVLIASGPGRLNKFFPHLNVASGLALIFYDSAVPASGGPFAASGHKIVWVSPPLAASASGAQQQLPSWPADIDIPFQSGLVVHTTSGHPGFSVAWTPEPAGQ